MCDKQYQASETSFVYSFAFLSFLFNTGAKPVFPDKSEKDKPKFAIKGQKQSSKYPYQLCLQTKFKFVFKYTEIWNMWKKWQQKQVLPLSLLFIREWGRRKGGGVFLGGGVPVWNYGQKGGCFFWEVYFSLTLWLKLWFGIWWWPQW